uniref:hypothetical protein n=1 Tax=Acetatifactor sp. TaxID=1872090 RepID=UPI00402542A6
MIVLRPEIIGIFQKAAFVIQPDYLAKNIAIKEKNILSGRKLRFQTIRWYLNALPGRFDDLQP